MSTDEERLQRPLDAPSATLRRLARSVFGAGAPKAPPTRADLEGA